MNDELLVKYLLGEATSAEIKSVEQWVNASLENSRYFNHFQLIWETSKQLVVPPTINTDEAWQRFEQRTEKASGKQTIVRRINSRFSWMHAAAILILSAGFLTLAYFLSNPGSNTPVTIASSNNPRSDTLPDGSVVMLNKKSSISYTPGFNRESRKVNLKGEAFFSVTRNEQKPFIISINDISVRVIGTSFNIKSTGETTQIIVETGIVQVTKNNSTILLRPNEKLVTSADERTLTKEKTTDRLHQYYRSKEFVCDKTPLWKLVEVLNEAYNANIVIESKELQSLPLTTTFYNESLEQILSVIGETFDISVQHKGGQILLTKQ
jgi:ferric-dicitrate binding protein FerR (iron transport regulator)